MPRQATFTRFQVHEVLAVAIEVPPGNDLMAGWIGVMLWSFSSASNVAGR